mmetsp:Transcript_99357/g.171023  ORF Transcript_99357/g.171023 Transcript_99357/m.171023 type:complete len:233 (+) Transcript_99357:464-1162(+)
MLDTSYIAKSESALRRILFSSASFSLFWVVCARDGFPVGSVPICIVFVSSLMQLACSGHVLSMAVAARLTSSSRCRRCVSSSASTSSQPAGPFVSRILQQKSSSRAGVFGFVNRMNVWGKCSRNLFHFFLNWRVTTASYNSGRVALMMFCTRSDGIDPLCSPKNSTTARSSSATFSMASMPCSLMPCVLRRSDDGAVHDCAVEGMGIWGALLKSLRPLECLARRCCGDGMPL